MATWFAQKSGNLSANDVFYDAPSGGNAKDVSTDSDNTIVLSANSYTIAIDEDVTALRLSTADEDAGGAGVAGGGFTVAAARTITANVLAGSTACLTASHAAGATVTVVGNVTGGGSSNTHGINNSSTGALSVTGNVTGGTATNANGIYNASTGVVSITGNVTGGNGSNRSGLLNNVAGVVSITGNVIADRGPGVTCYSSTVSVTVVGDIINSVYYSAVVGTIIYNPGAGNYIEYPKPTSGVYKYGKTIPKAYIVEGIDSSVAGSGAAPEAGTYRVTAVGDVKKDVQFGDTGSLQTGTYEGGGTTVIVVED